MADDRMNDTFDIAIAGLGAFGAAAAASLVERGERVLGLDRFRPPHALGSSHGGSRMIREAYFEAPFYVPLVQFAYERWASLERRVETRLLEITRGLMMGSADGDLVSGCLESARLHDLACETLSADEIRARFPFEPDTDTVGVLEPRAGMLDPERCIGAFLEIATRGGAELRYDEPLKIWSWRDGVVELCTGAARYRARRLLVAAGAWTASLLPELRLPLEVERVIQFWFRPIDGQPGDLSAQVARCPVWAWEYAPGRIWFGFPDRCRGVKAGFHQSGVLAEPDSVEREVSVAECQTMREAVTRYMPQGAGPLLEAAVCIYTNTPDGHFLIDRHPERPEIWLATGGSGHGFKFAAGLGEILADLLTDREPAFDLSPFRLGRFV
jgi:sarcosine oxidase